jgi:hypothetical protein
MGGDFFNKSENFSLEVADFFNKGENFFNKGENFFLVGGDFFNKKKVLPLRSESPADTAESCQMPGMGSRRQATKSRQALFRQAEPCRLASADDGASALPGHEIRHPDP